MKLTNAQKITERKSKFSGTNGSEKEPYGKDIKEFGKNQEENYRIYKRAYKLVKQIKEEIYN